MEKKRENGNLQVISKFVFTYVYSVILKYTVTDAKSLTP